jgi:hypothetical protein
MMTLLDNFQDIISVYLIHERSDVKSSDLNLVFHEITLYNVHAACKL